MLYSLSTYVEYVSIYYIISRPMPSMLANENMRKNLLAKTRYVNHTSLILTLNYYIINMFYISFFVNFTFILCKIINLWIILI